MQFLALQSLGQKNESKKGNGMVLMKAIHLHVTSNIWNFSIIRLSNIRDLNCIKETDRGTNSALLKL